MNVYLFLHILGAVIFVGNIITAAFWKIRADLKGDLPVIHQATKNVMLADYLFTIPGLILLVWTGNVMTINAGYSMAGFNWLTLSLFLFALTGLIWLAVLLPVQRKMIRLSGKATESDSINDMGNKTLPAKYRTLSLLWAIFGTIATLLPIAILYLMIAKPF